MRPTVAEWFQAFSVDRAMDVNVNVAVIGEEFQKLQRGHAGPPAIVRDDCYAFGIVMPKLAVAAVWVS
jgi:hypothetical protein